MMDIMDSKPVSSFNLQRTLILVSAVATQSMRHRRAHHQTKDIMGMESSGDLETTEDTKESKD
jgi:hypothetical protein